MDEESQEERPGSLAAVRAPPNVSRRTTAVSKATVVSESCPLACNMAGAHVRNCSAKHLAWERCNGKLAGVMTS
eukprot:15446480-Alexandrium_andersonii.AAC.1